MVDRAAEYRRNAEASEELARTTIHPAIGEQFRNLAKQWRVLADRVESTLSRYHSLHPADTPEGPVEQ